MEPGAAGELAALALNSAGSVADVREALGHWRMPAVEVVYAERNGAIGSQVAAHVPVRRGFGGRLPAAGWLGRAVGAAGVRSTICRAPTIRRQGTSPQPTATARAPHASARRSGRRVFDRGFRPASA